MLLTRSRQVGTSGRARPFLKWAGGKRQLLDQLLPLLPGRYRRYFEPFLGGGAVFFAVRPPRAFLSDSNPELINAYRVLRDRPEALLGALATFRPTQDSYYHWRAKDVARLSDVQRAARLIFLNRTCFNGLYRVNRRGEFNVPFGRHRSPPSVREDELRSASAALRKARLARADYRTAVEQAAKGDFVYLDPPYHPISRYSDFKRYTQEFFGPADHAELAEVVHVLTHHGVQVMLSNSDCARVRKLYRGYRLTHVWARRRINSDVSKRHAIRELVIRNY